MDIIIRSEMVLSPSKCNINPIIKTQRGKHFDPCSKYLCGAVAKWSSRKVGLDQLPPQFLHFVQDMLRPQSCGRGEVCLSLIYTIKMFDINPLIGFR
jgi:hypothetical protein